MLSWCIIANRSLPSVWENLCIFDIIWLSYLSFSILVLELPPPHSTNTRKKTGSIEQNEENCNLNIHKALCLFPSHLCWREIFLFRCGFWQLPLTVTSLCPKSPWLLLRATSNLNIIVGLEENANRLDIPSN